MKFVSVSFDILLPIYIPIWHWWKSVITHLSVLRWNCWVLWEYTHALCPSAFRSSFYICSIPSSSHRPLPVIGASTGELCVIILWVIPFTCSWMPFQGGYKDGTNGTRDCSYFPLMYLVVRILLLVIYAITLCGTTYIILSGVTVIAILIVVSLVSPGHLLQLSWCLSAWKPCTDVSIYCSQ